MRAAAPDTLQSVFVFDVYRGSNLGTTFKSMALGLIFQDSSRTLTDTEIDSAMARINAEVAARLGATGRT